MLTFPIYLYRAFLLKEINIIQIWPQPFNPLQNDVLQTFNLFEKSKLAHVKKLNHC